MAISFQEQEREMQIRQEQQKHQYMMSSAGGYYMPGVSMQQYQPGFSNQPGYANPQQFHQMMPQPTTDGSLAMPGQPQLSQAMGVNPMASTAQTMPAMSQGYPLSTPSAVAVSQANINTQQNMPGNVRQPLSQQMPMMIQQMHQMRLPSQTGQLGQNGYTGQNIPQQNGQAKQLGQPQPGQPMMPPISVAQANLSQQQMISTNPMLNMQMQNMRSINQHPSMYANPQLGQLPSQIMSGQPMSLPSQQMIQSQGMPGQGPMQGFIPPSSQSLPQGPQVPQSQGQQLPQQQQLTQGQPMSLPNQPIPTQPGQMSMTMIQGQPVHSQSQSIQPGQQIIQQGQQVPQHGQMPQQGQQMGPQGQQIGPQGQQMGPQGQQIAPQGQQLPPQGQQMPPGVPMTQGPQFQQNQMPQGPNQGLPIQGQQMAPQQMPQAQQAPQMMSQGQQVPQGQPMPQNNTGQPMKMAQNFNPQQPPSQTGPTNVKSEHNNNTAELISFD